jgi:hypothetical protein
VIRGAGRIAFHKLTRVLTVGARRWPRGTLRTADFLGGLLRHGVRADDVRTLLPHLSANTIARLVRRSRAGAMRSHLLVETVRHYGLTPVRRLVPPNAALAALRPPLIVGVFHIGPVIALATAVEQLRGNVFIIRRSTLPLERVPSITIETAVGDEQRRALAFHRALQRLRDGDFVVMALDPEHALRLPVPCLGRTFQLARGPFALARLAGVPIVPLIPRWRGTEVELAIGQPLTPAPNATTVDDYERSLAEAAGRWLEQYLLEHPEELSARVVELLK